LFRLSRFPRRRYARGPSSLEPLERLTQQLGGPNLWIKRDDEWGPAGGGNKNRKLEFLVADALAQGADTLITTGAVQSNHCRLTLAAAAREGLQGRLVLEERVPGSYDPEGGGNHLLFHLFGVEAIRLVPAGADLGQEMVKEAEALASEGRKAYIVPGGGSNALGALGYVSCGLELLHQAFDVDLRIDAVVCASGSGGTHAGLVAAFAAAQEDIPVVGISVRHPKEAQESRIRHLAGEVLELMGLPAQLPGDAVEVIDDQVGPGYSLPTEAMIRAVRVLACTEGILLDPVYTGKAMAGMIALVEQGRFAEGQNVLFVHTGGSDSLSAFASDFHRRTSVEA